MPGNGAVEDVLSWSCGAGPMIRLGDSWQHIQYPSSALMQHGVTVAAYTVGSQQSLDAFCGLGTTAGVCIRSLPG